MTSPQLFGQRTYSALEEKSLEFVFTDVTASIIHMNGIKLRGDGVLNVEKLSSLRVFVPIETSKRMGEMDFSGAALEDQKRVDSLTQLGLAPVLRDKHFIQISVNEQTLFGETELKPCDVEASKLPKFFRKLLGEHKLVYQMAQCSESPSVPDLLRAVQENGMENLAWIEVYRMQGIIGTINDEWYLAPSSYGVLGLEGSVIKLTDACKMDFWPQVPDVPSNGL